MHALRAGYGLDHRLPDIGARPPDVGARPPRDGCVAERRFPAHADDAATRAFISRRYAQAHEAKVRCDYRELVVVEDERGRCRAAAGFRRPDEPFFLEHYLDADAGTVLSGVYGRSVPRATIVEIGNLAADDPRATFTLLQGLLHHLSEEGYEHVLLTCTRRLGRWFRDLPHVRLANADPARVPDAARWGRYYEHAPEVITGRLRDYDQRFALLTGRGGLAFRVVPPPRPMALGATGSTIGPVAARDTARTTPWRAAS